MNLKRPTSIALSLILGMSLAVSAVAQQKRPTPAKPQPQKVAPAPATPPPTFDTLLAADSYRVYGEVRSVGQLIRSNSITEILEPILKLAGPPKEFRTVVKWLNFHADELMTSRMLVAAWPSTPQMPSVLITIEFASPEEATKFRVQLNEFLGKMVPPTPQTKPAAEEEPPPYHLQQAGSLILVTRTKFDLKKLRPAGSKLLSEDVNFRVARNRFNSESIFIYVDVDGIEKEEQEQRRQAEEAHQKVVEALNEAEAKALRDKLVETMPPPATPETSPPEEPPPPAGTGPTPVLNNEVVGVVKDGPTEPNPTLMALVSLGSAFTNGEGKWPTGLGIAISLDGESFDVRALMVNSPGEKSDPIPFLPVLTPGPSIAPTAPSILPADTEMLVNMSLDFPQIYAGLSKPPIGLLQPAKDIDFQPPYAALEKQLKIKINEDLLPLLGSEIVLTLPLSGLDLAQPPGTPVSDQQQTKPDAKDPVKEAPKTTRSPAVAIALRDKEGMLALLPKIVESLAFKGATAFAQTERRGDTELVTYANVLSYAFIGDFLVLSPDAATTKHIVDSYLKGETLASEPHFKNYTRWQPRQLQGQVYISPALMESYRKWVNEPSSAAQIDEQTRAFLARLSIVAQPVTYSLSNEGFGPLHELHVPKNLVLMFIAGVSGAVNAPAVEPAKPITAPKSP